MIKYIKGDLIHLAKQGKFDIIAHGCNCFNNMGAGIAKSIRLNFPQAYKADCNTIKGDKKKLGTITYHKSDNLTVVNCYSQYEFGGGKVNINYRALENSLIKMKELCDKDSKIGLPKIGCGLAKGDWNKVSKIIDEVFDGYDITVVIF